MLIKWTFQINNNIFTIEYKNKSPYFNIQNSIVMIHKTN